MNILTIKQWQALNEVRLPCGSFIVTKPFRIPSANGQWEEIFNLDDQLILDPANKSIKKWNKTLDRWDQNDINWKEIIKPEIYSVFKNAVKKIETESESEKENSFKSTVKQFNKKAEDHGLQPNDKITVTY